MKVQGWMLLAALAGGAQAEPKLVISAGAQLRLAAAPTLVHSGPLLVYQYGDWSFSHEALQGDSLYQGVDLTGMEVPFVRSLFEPRLRQEFAPWLAALSEEQTQVLGITEANINHSKVGDMEVWSSYNPQTRRGEAFIFVDQAVHRLSMKGGKTQFDELLSAISRR